MMTSTERKLVRYLTAFFYGLTIFIFIGLFFWFYPRQIIKSSTLMQTDKSEYAQGEEIIVSGETWTNVDSPADFDVRLLCNGTKYAYTQINDLQVSKQVAPVKYSFPYPEIPRYIPNGSTCRIETTSNYTVQVLPMFTRHYQHKFNSNTFQIKE